MNIILWALQLLLALVYAYSGTTKASQPVPRLLALGQTGVEHMPVGLVRFVGVAELLGSAGLILPWASQRAPALTPLAALGLAIIMLLAIGVHLERREYRTVVANVLLCGCCLIVAGARLFALNSAGWRWF
ncbi:MAG TPA: DoxX family protein [Gemmatimonadaceae bacterium]|nr:DoxX family protein [Gemmatimonadaceae bacterium]